MKSSAKKNVLIIEDDIFLSDNIRILLSKNNINVSIAHNGKEGLELCRETLPDLILCDGSLPDISGFSVIEELKINELTKSIPIIFLSGSADSESIQKGLSLGVKEYITKPFKPDELVKTIYSSISDLNEEKQSILIIEDDPDIRDNLYSLFSKSGYGVLLAANGEEGLETAFNNIPGLVICDILLPGLDGYSVLKELSANDMTRTIPFIYLSAKSELSDLRKGMSLGADDYITKPFKSADLLNSVEKRMKKLLNIKDYYKFSANSSKGNHIKYEDKQSVSNNFNNSAQSTESQNENYPIEKAESKNRNDFKINEEISAASPNNSETPKTIQSSNLKKSSYEDKEFETFLENRSNSSDFESYCYNNVLVILNNLPVAISKEAALFYKYLNNAIENKYLNIVIDMSRVDIIDSTFSGVLIRCKKMISKKGGNIKLIMKIKNQFSNMMIQQSLENNIEIHSDLKTAIQSFNRAININQGMYSGIAR